MSSQHNIISYFRWLTRSPTVWKRDCLQVYQQSTPLYKTWHIILCNENDGVPTDLIDVWEHQWKWIKWIQYVLCITVLLFLLLFSLLLFVGGGGYKTFRPLCTLILDLEKKKVKINHFICFPDLQRKKCNNPHVLLINNHFLTWIVLNKKQTHV